MNLLQDRKVPADGGRSGKAACSTMVSLCAAVAFCLMTVAGCGQDMPDSVAAYVNGNPVTMHSLETAARNSGYVQGNDGLPESVRLDILEKLIEKELVLQQAGRMEVTVTDQELAAEVEKFKGDINDKEFQEILVAEFVDFDEWLEGLKKNILIEKTTEAYVQPRVKIDPRDWASFFEAHRRIEPEPLRMKVIFVNHRSRKDAEDFLDKVKTGGDFKVLAEKELKDAGGTMPVEPRWVLPGNLPEQFAGELVSARAGDVTGVVESGYGFSVFKILEVKEPSMPEPAELMANIRRLYLKQKADDIYGKWVTALKAGAEIEVNPTLLDSREE